MKRAQLFLAVLAFATSLPQLAAQQPAKSASATRSAPGSCGPLVESMLRCPRFGFTYRTTVGWVDRTDDMQPEAESQDPESERAESDRPEAGASNPRGSQSETLLAVFERPPAAPGDTINSAVVIVAESLADYHGIKTASDYFGPISELAEQRGFKVENEPHAVSIGTRKLVRGDFSKDRGKVTMWQSSLVMIEKGYVVSFTFVGGSEGEVEELIGNLSFGMRAPAPQGPRK